MVKDFLIQVKQSYLASGKYLQNAYDIKNPILETFSAIDPVTRWHNLTFTYLSKLFSHLKFILQGSTNSDYFNEIKRYQLGKSLPACTQESYPDISLLYLAATSIRLYQKLLKHLYRYSLGHKQNRHLVWWMISLHLLCHVCLSKGVFHTCQ